MSSSFVAQSNQLAPLVGRHISKAYGDHVVLDGVDVVASPGLPLGMVGENGAGKSTLLRLLAGAEPADSGTVSAPVDLVYLAQEPDFPDYATIGEVLAAALAPLHDGVARMELLAGRLEDPQAADEYAELLEWTQLHAAWDADRRAEMAAQRLGLGELDRERPVAALSGASDRDWRWPPSSRGGRPACCSTSRRTTSTTTR